MEYICVQDKALSPYILEIEKRMEEAKTEL